MERREMVVSRGFCARDDPEGLSLTREMMITFREQKKREYRQG